VGGELQRDGRVLDLGSGKGSTSVFLAKEYGVQVWAADLWIEPSEADQGEYLTFAMLAARKPAA
jgi:cyclopropane fatty-acyl-phospholipid synthase-like methyltransferase